MQSLGIDISKDHVHAALLGEGKIAKQSFSNNATGFRQLFKWLANRGVDQVHACMESTSGLEQPLAVELHNHGHLVSIVNPALIKHFGQSEGLRTKTDGVDAALIARFCELHKPATWTPPSPAEQALQGLERHRHHLIGVRAQEKTRLQSPGITDPVRKSTRKMIAFLDKSVAEIEDQIKKHIDSDPDLRSKCDLLTTINGIGDTTAKTILAEAPHLAEFRDVKAVGAYIGATPKHNQSGKSDKPAHICRTGNARLRTALYFPAMSAIRYNPTLRAFAQRLEKRGKCPKVIITAVMRKLLTIAYGVLKSGRPFEPCPTLVAP